MIIVHHEHILKYIKMHSIHSRGRNVTSDRVTRGLGPIYLQVAYLSCKHSKRMGEGATLPRDQEMLGARGRGGGVKVGDGGLGIALMHDTGVPYVASLWGKDKNPGPPFWKGGGGVIVCFFAPSFAILFKTLLIIHLERDKAHGNSVLPWPYILFFWAKEKKGYKRLSEPLPAGHPSPIMPHRDN